LKAQSVAEAEASPALSRSSKEPVEETAQSSIEMESHEAFCEEVDFRQLLKQLLSGEQTKEALLLNTVFQRRVPIICQGFALNAADADDLTNYVRLAVCERLDQFKPNYQRRFGNFFNWVSRIARNQAIDNFSRTVGRQGDGQAEKVYAVQDEVDIEAEAEHHEAIERFWTFVDKRDAVIQKIMRYHLEDHSLREIGEKLAAEGIRLSHVAIGNLVRNVLADFMASENARHPGTIARKGKYLARGRGRERGDPSARKTGS
jgi:RNA polymerase sigma factor (sigma-70 family)